MKKIVKLSFIVSILILTIASFTNAKAQTITEDMKTFFDSMIPGLKIQVNATMEAQPTQNISVILKMTALLNVSVKFLNLSIVGFSWSNETSIGNIGNGTSFSLQSASSKIFNATFRVPGNVWHVTSGKLALTYSTKTESGGVNETKDYPPFSMGFTMTYVENVYLEGMEELLENLNSTFLQSFGMNLTLDNLAKLNETYRGLQGSVGDLDNTRRVVAILAVTTVFFVATTVYMVMRKPKESW
ncbi:hypothetical protein HXY33_08355 [Candidatus Bathyarchaeota archaeon]|nr:hypothetical protein [Candidatus Bathyarchaeota archaeon]